MANGVFANGREVSCKAGAGKTICAMPDVCFTPPENPATPPGVPVPYPNTGKASDTTDGSKKVKITNKEVGLKNKSCFKKSMGDEAGAAAKKGVITSKNTGKVFFESWSMDVKIEGQNAVRHLDMTTNNHASTPGDTPPFPEIESQASPPPPPNKEDCRLRPYKPKTCPDGKTGHHCVPDHCLLAPTVKGKKGKRYPGVVSHGKGLCVCVEGAGKIGPHGKIHKKFDKLEKKLGEADGTATLGELEDAAAEAISEETGCNKEDLKKQMRDYNQSKGMGPDTRLRADPFGTGGAPAGAMGTNMAPASAAP